MPRKREGERYCFNVEWKDQQADLVRQYRLLHWPSNNSVELFDLKNRRTFLKRCVYPSIQLNDLYIGAQVSVYSRQLTVSGYGDQFTKMALASLKARTLGLVAVDAYEVVGSVLEAASKEGLVLSRICTTRLSQEQAAALLGADAPVAAIERLTNGNVVAAEFVGEREAWARAAATPGLKKYSSSLFSCEIPQLDVFAGAVTTARMADCTCCVVLPHAVQSGLIGPIVQHILDEGFEISAMQLLHLERAAAEEFLEVYKTVIPEYSALVSHLTSGPCVALEIVGDRQVVQEFRELCGPADPEIARHVRPTSIRARFGNDKIRRAVHCTDLAEDGVLESEFFFSAAIRQQ